MDAETDELHMAWSGAFAKVWRDALSQRHSFGKQSRWLPAGIIIGRYGRQRCLDAGMDDFLTKPISVQHLRRVLAELEEQPSAGPLAVA